MRLALSFELARRRICDRFKVPVSARARRQARPGQGSDGLPSLRERALRCSRSWPVAELTSLAALSTFKQAATSQSTKRTSTRAASNAVLLGGAHSPCPGRARRLAGEAYSSRCRPTPTAGRPEGGAALGRLCAAEKHRASGRVRTRTLRHLTRSLGSTTASAASGGRHAAGQKTEHRRAPSRSEGKQSEPQRRTALGPAPKHQLQTSCFRNGVTTDRNCQGFAGRSN